MKNKLIKEAKNFDIELEIMETISVETSFSYLNKIEKDFQINHLKNYLIKAIKDGKCIKISTEDITDSKEIIDNLLSIFNIQDNDNKNRLSEGNIENQIRNKEILDYNEVKRDFLKIYDELDKYQNIVNVELGYSHIDESYNLINENSNMIDELYLNSYAASISIKNANITKVCYVSYFSKNYDIAGFKNEILMKLENLNLKLNSDSIKTDKYDIILTNNVVCDLLNTFSSMFNAKNIDLKESVLCDKFNEKIFSDKITIREEPISDNYLIERLFDNEGIKTSNKILVDKGIFKNKVNNLEYAIKNNEEPTGNAGGFVNLIIDKGNNTFDELQSKLNNGYIIDELYGMHAGIDIKTGDISLQAEGIYVNDGKKISGVERIILATNIFELFNNIVLVGNDLSKCSYKTFTPSLLISKITIAGEK